MSGLGLVDRVLRAVLPAGPAADAIRGDLREEHGRRRARGRVSAGFWYTAQAVTVMLWSVLDRMRGRTWGEVGVKATRRRQGPSAGGDLADGLRVLHRSPGYSFAVVATLGLALATTVTVFTVVRGVLLRDLPYPEPDRLVRLDRINDGEPGNGGVGWLDLLDWRERIGSLSGIAAHTGYEGLYVAEGVAEIWRGRGVTDNLLDVLGVAPYPGRDFDAETGAPGTKSILLSHEVWERRFGGDPSIVGRTVPFDDEVWQVTGVLPRGFAYPWPDVDFLVPLPRTGMLDNRGTGFLQTIARLTDGVSLGAARQEVDAVVSAIDAETGEWREGVALRRYADVQVAAVREMLWLFMGAVTLVLLVACTNVAGLTLARTESRRLELSIRASLGASRGRLIRQMLVESVTLALAGAGVGVAGAIVGVRGLLSVAPPDLPRRDAVHIDPAVLGFAVLASLAAALLFGLLPALRGAGSGTAVGLRRSATGLRGGQRTRHILAAAQIAVAVVLLSGAGLLLRSFAALSAVDPGFRTDGVLTVELGLDATRYQGREATLALHDALLDRVRAIPGVTSTGLSTHLPFSPSNITVTIGREGEAYVRGEADELGMEMYNGDYFRTMGLPAVRGVLPEPGAPGPPRQVVVNESAARLLWPGADPIGRRFSFDLEEGQLPAPDTWFTVVAVVPDVRKRSLDEPTVPLAYYALPDFSRFYTFVSGRFFYLTIATDGDAAALLDPVRDAIGRIDPALPIRSSATMEHLVRATTVPARFRTLALGVFALLAVGVAFVGIHGVMAYGVSRGLSEIGVRLALGATPADVRRRVLRQAGAVAAVGGAVGLTGAMLAGPVLAGVLFHVAPRDPLTLAAVLVLAGAGSVVAAWLPALRASRVDPVSVLRRE